MAFCSYGSGRLNCNPPGGTAIRNRNHPLCHKILQMNCRRFLRNTAKEVKTIKRPAYFLWKSDFPTEAEFDCAKNFLGNLGFRVSAYLDGPKETDIHQGLKALLKNHRKESAS